MVLDIVDQALSRVFLVSTEVVLDPKAAKAGSLFGAERGALGLEARAFAYEEALN